MWMREDVGMLYEDGGCAPYFHSRTRIQMTFRRADCPV
jgi:hypothetical protein